MPRRLPFALGLALTVAACSGGGGTEGAPDPSADPADPVAITVVTTPAPVTSAPGEPAASLVLPPDAAVPTVNTTLHRADGNRFAAGWGAMPEAAPIDVVLSGVPRWVVGAPVGDAAAWVVALEDGTLEAFTIEGSAVAAIALNVTALPPNTPPAVVVRDGVVDVLEPGPGDSALSHPVLLTDGTQVAIRADGSIGGAEDPPGASVVQDALVDGRLLADEEGRMLVLTGPTDRYPHGVLGDILEPSRATVVAPAGGTAAVIEVSAPDVIEGIAPVWADVDGDGDREIVVTLSNASDGARVAALESTGPDEAALGPPIGRGNRWRHVIAVAPLGPAGEIEIAAVRTPHIGGVVEFYRWRAGRLDIEAEIAGFTSHVIGTRNLDLALAADADGDGQAEVVLPTQDRRSLAGVRHAAGGAETAWTVPLDGTLSSNLAAVELSGGRLALAAGRDDGVLRIWPAGDQGAAAAALLDRSDDASLERILTDHEALLAAGPRVAGTAAEAAAADYLAAVLARDAAVAEREEVIYLDGRRSENLWVTLGDGSTHVLLGGHYDSKAGSPGADDNASGVAVLLELARRLAEQPVPGVRTTVAFFGAEEIPAGLGPDDHHYGSRLRAARLAEQNALPDLMVSVDQVGFGERLLAVRYEDADPTAAELLATAAGALALDVAVESRGDISDHEAFARRGVPATLMWRPDNPAYHTPDDTSVRPAALLEDLAILEEMLALIASGPS